MSKGDKTFLNILVIVMTLIIGILIGGRIDTAERYRQGQIDALTGKVKYELKANSDSTVTWYKKEK